MTEKLWTVARFPAGVWTTGGTPDDPEYEGCEVWQVLAKSREDAKKKAQYLRAKQKKQDSK